MLVNCNIEDVGWALWWQPSDASDEKEEEKSAIKKKKAEEKLAVKVCCVTHPRLPDA